MNPRPFTARIERKTKVAENVYAFVLALDGTAVQGIEPGAHIDVHLPGGRIRQYSLVDFGQNHNRLEIAILRDADGAGGSVHLCDAYEAGDYLVIGGPRNTFRLDLDRPRYVLLGGGIGVTPLISMASSLARSQRDFVFHICAPTPEALAYHALLTAQPWADRIVYHFSRTAAPSRLDLPSVFASTPTDAQIYACGPARMMDALDLLGRDSPAGRLRTERFAAKTFTEDPSEQGVFIVELRKSKLRFPVSDDSTILQEAVRHGVQAPSSCKTGTCATCLTKVISGELIHRDSCLYPEEQAAGDQMAICVSRAKPGTTLVLDL
jgi:vanillate O-demethylase ferredoxin subunit